MGLGQVTGRRTRRAAGGGRPVNSGLAGRRDLNPLIGMLSLAKRDYDLKNAVVVARCGLLGLRALRQFDGPAQRAVPEFRALAVLALLLPFGMNTQDSIADSDVDVLVHIQSGEFCADDETALFCVMLHPEGWGQPELRQRSPW